MVLLIWLAYRLSHTENAGVLILQFSGMNEFLTTVEGGIKFS
jgi:hypothetical protein